MVYCDLDFTKKKPVKCIHCGKEKSMHLAVTFHCPQGRAHRTLGYSSFSRTTVFEPRPQRKSP